MAEVVGDDEQEVGAWVGHALAARHGWKPDVRTTGAHCAL